MKNYLIRFVCIFLLIAGAIVFTVVVSHYSALWLGEDGFVISLVFLFCLFMSAVIALYTG